MRTKSEILSRLDELQQIRAGTEELFVPVKKAVEDYFDDTSQLTHDLQYTLHQIIQDAISRNTVYENQDAMPSAQTDYPEGYRDVREIFIGNDIFEEIISVDDEDFTDAYYEVESDAETPTTNNQYLEKWSADLQKARTEELKSLGNIANFCESDGYNRGLAQLFESVGEVVSSTPLNDLAKQIYIDRGYKEIIEFFNLKIYIPTIGNP